MWIDTKNGIINTKYFIYILKEYDPKNDFHTIRAENERGDSILIYTSVSKSNRDKIFSSIKEGIRNATKVLKL